MNRRMDSLLNKEEKRKHKRRMDGHTKGFIFILHQHSQFCGCCLFRHEGVSEDHDLTDYTLFMASSSSWKVTETTQHTSRARRSAKQKLSGNGCRVLASRRVGCFLFNIAESHQQQHVGVILWNDEWRTDSVGLRIRFGVYVTKLSASENV